MICMYISEVNSDVRAVRAEEMFVDGDPDEKVIEITFDNDLKLRDENLYLTLQDHLAVVSPLKKRLKEMEHLAQELAACWNAPDGNVDDARLDAALARLSTLCPQPSALSPLT